MDIAKRLLTAFLMPGGSVWVIITLIRIVNERRDLEQIPCSQKVR